MLEIGYPNVGKHQKLHTNLMVELNVMISRVVSHREYPENLLEFLNRWLTDHIDAHDRHVAEHALKANSRPVAEGVYKDYLTS